MKIKTITKRLFGIALTTALTLTLAQTVLASNKYYNFGLLDIRPIMSENAQNRDWFVEYIAPGQTVQERFIVSNFSPAQKTVSLYVTDTDTNEGSKFYVRSLEEKSEDINSWINLPANTVTLEPGQAKAVTVKFKIPETAGIGLHTGAIIARDNGGEISFEKGIRIYLNVVGPAITRAEPSQITQTQSASNIAYNFAVENKGTTDFKKDYRFELQTILGEPLKGLNQSLEIRRGQTGTAAFVFKKPSYGLYKVTASDGERTSVIDMVLFIPFWMPLLAILLIVLAYRTQINFSIDDFQRPFRTLRPALQIIEVKRSLAYFVLFTLIASSLSVGIGFNQKTMASHPVLAVGKSYELIVKWGEFRHFRLPDTYRHDWKGKIIVSNGTFSIEEMLHLEKDDSIELSGDSRILSYKLTTGPDNDGVILKVLPTTDEAPIISYDNEYTKSVVHFKITDLSGRHHVYPDAYWGAYFAARPYEEKVVEKGLKAITIEDLSATPELELEATPEEKPAFIPELENLFIEDLPATPEILTDIVLNSQYIKTIEQEDGTAKVETDSILIEALEATPEILEDIVATPDLNFIFIPSETVSFPATEFSFDENRISEQVLGTLIFVQNKETPWNTYAGTTDFISLSSDSMLPASSLTINPGKPVTLKEKEEKFEKEDGITIIKKLGSTKITGGKQRQFIGKFDKTLLVDVEPQNESEQIFVLNPVLRIFVPAGTVAGRYRGQLTITSL
jgi:hypothetical protein